MTSRSLRRLLPSLALAVVTSASIPVAYAGVPSASRPVGAATAAAVTATSRVVEGFDTSTTTWTAVEHAASLSVTSSAPGAASGTHFARIGYDFTSGARTASIAPLGDDPGLGLDAAPRRLSVAIYGDGSYNVPRVQLRDATGELFHISLGAMSRADAGQWVRKSVPLGGTGIPTVGGDGDGVLDLPVRLHRLLVDRNQAEIRSEVGFDEITLEADDASALSATPERFAAGKSTELRLVLDAAASFTVTLTDVAPGGSPLTWTWSGVHDGGGVPVTRTWDGRSSGGTQMRGSIQARLSLDRGYGPTHHDLPYFAGITLREASATPGSMVGINTYLNKFLPRDRATAEQHARLAEEAYVGMAREQFTWSLIEPTNDDFRWERMDQMVELHRARGIEVLGILAYSACWASSAPAGTSCSTAQFYRPDLTHYVDYVKRVVGRYKDRVKLWEVWNEENWAPFYKPAPDAAAYTELLIAASKAIKEVDPKAKVLIGGLAGGADEDFLESVAANGGWPHFDILAIHTYVSGAPETSILPTWLDNARALLRRMGTPLRPIWVTEFGWSRVDVTEAEQAAFLHRAYLAMARSGVRGAFWYNLVEHGRSTSSRLDNYGLVELADTGEMGARKTPGYRALQRVGESLDQGTTMGVSDVRAGSRWTFAVEAGDVGNWKPTGLGGAPAPTLAAATSTEPRHGGASSLGIAYDFGGGTGVEIRRDVTLGAAGATPSSVAIWVAGDGSGNPLYVKVADRCGEVFSGAVGSLLSGWQRLVLYMDGSDRNWVIGGGTAGCGAAKVLDYPLKLRSVMVLKSAAAGVGITSGRFFLDDVQADSGPRIRGLVISRRGSVAQALYRLDTPGTVAVPVSGSTAYLVDGPTSTALSVASGKVSTTVSDLPVNVVSAPALSAASVVPGSAVTMWFVGGDMTRYALAVLNPTTGAVLRTVTAGAFTDAGLRRVTWDGDINGQDAAAGRYVLRLTITGADGRVSYLSRTVTVA